MALNSTAAQVVLCDVHMPGPTGLWLAERIGGSYPTTAVVFATADPRLQPVQRTQRGDA